MHGMPLVQSTSASPPAGSIEPAIHSTRWDRSPTGLSADLMRECAWSSRRQETGYRKTFVARDVGRANCKSRFDHSTGASRKFLPQKKHHNPLAVDDKCIDARDALRDARAKRGRTSRSMG